MSQQAKAAKEALEIAVTEYKRCKLLVERGLTAAPVNERNVTGKLLSLSNALKELNSLRASWLVKAGLDTAQLSAEQYSPK